jgi:hypothetical protein
MDCRVEPGNLSSDIPPGRARLATAPVPTGSPIIKLTMGIVDANIDHDICPARHRAALAGGGRRAMSIAPQLDGYLSVRRSLGYDLRTDERILRRFIRFADQAGASYIDTALFLRWDASLPDVGTSTRSARFGKVRLFAQWLSGIDPAHEVPPRGLLPHHSGRPQAGLFLWNSRRTPTRCGGPGPAAPAEEAWMVWSASAAGISILR